MRCTTLIKRALSLLLVFGLPVQAQISVPPGGNYDVPTGATVDLACTGLDIQGALTVGAGELDQITTVGIAAGGSINGGSGTLSLSGDWNNAGTFVPGTSTVVLTDGCGLTSSTLSGTTVFNNLTLTSTTGHTFVIPTGSNIVVTGTLTLQGTNGQPIQVVSAGGSSVIALGPGASVVSNFANVAGNVQIGNGVPGTNTIPTLSEWARMLLTLLIAGIAVHSLRRFRA